MKAQTILTSEVEKTLKSGAGKHKYIMIYEYSAYCRWNANDWTGHRSPPSALPDSIPVRQSCSDAPKQCAPRDGLPVRSLRIPGLTKKMKQK